MVGFIKKHIYILILLIIGFALRLSSALSHSFSSDELSAITRLKIDGFSNIIEQGVKKGDMHPAGIQLFEEFWSSIFGVSELSLRFPFVCFGTLAILVTYLIGIRFLTKQAAIIAATLLAVTYFPVLHSELARPYSPGLFFSLLVAWFWLNLIFIDKNKWLNAILLGFSFALAMYTHYFAFMLVGFIGLTGLFYLNKRTFVPYFIAGLIGVTLFLPHLSVTIYHLSVDGGLQWLGRPNNLWIFNFIYYSFNESYLFIFLIIAIYLYTRLKNIGDFNYNKRYIFIFLIWFFGIYIIGHLFSLYSSPILKYPVMLFALPFLFLVIGALFKDVGKHTFIVLFVLLLFFGSMSTILEKELYGNKHYGVFKELVEPMVRWRSEYKKENIITFMNVSNPYYLNYYALPLGDSLTFEKDVMSFNEDIAIRQTLLNCKKEFCIVGYSQRLTLPMVLETCLEFYPNIIEYKRLNNCAVFLLSKRETNLIKRKNIVFSDFSIGKKNLNWIYDKNNFKDDYYLCDSLNIYGPDFKFKLKDINADFKYSIKIEVKADIDLQGELTASFSAKRNGFLVKDNNGNNLWMGHDLENMLNSPKNNNIGYYSFNVPDFIKNNDEIQISLWNRNGKSIKLYWVKIILVENIWN